MDAKHEVYVHTCKHTQQHTQSFAAVNILCGQRIELSIQIGNDALLAFLDYVEAACQASLPTHGQSSGMCAILALGDQPCSNDMHIKLSLL
jgi:hypothetical protein